MGLVTRVDVLILGGGTSGLWLLDDLHGRGYRVALVEAGQLGAGQTISSQGIIHGGLKYALGGRATKASLAIRDMPRRWRRSLAGEHHPNLTRTRLRAEYCCIWSRAGVRSRLGLLGASLSLSVKPTRLEVEARPPLLTNWAGPVFRLGEQVIEPGSFLQDLADQHKARILRVDGPQGIDLISSNPDGTSAKVSEVNLRGPGGHQMVIEPGQLILTAGGGNARIRNRLGLPVEHVQERPLQMILLRGPLPRLNGHCIRNASPWLTITSTSDHADRTIWQIGGQVAEDTATAPASEALSRARHDLSQALPDLDLSSVEMTTYRAVRAEGGGQGHRPDTPTVLREGNVVTAWPTKLALAPLLADAIAETLDPPSGQASFTAPPDWPSPTVAIPPWELESSWTIAS